MASNFGNWWDYQRPRIKEFLRGDSDKSYVTEYDMPQQRTEPVPKPSVPAQQPPSTQAQQATRMPGRQEIYQSLVNGVPTFSDQPGPKYQVTKSPMSSGQQETYQVGDQVHVGNKSYKIRPDTPSYIGGDGRSGMTHGDIAGINARIRAGDTRAARGETGYTNVIPGLKPVDYARAMQAFLRDGQYANAAAIAQNPQDLQEIGRVRRMNEIKRELSNPISMKQSFSSMGAQKRQRASLAKELETLQNLPAEQTKYAAALAGKELTARAGAPGKIAEMHKNFAEAYNELYPTDVQGFRSPDAPSYTDFVQQYLTGQQTATGVVSPMQADALRARPEYSSMMAQMRKKYAAMGYSDSQLEAAVFRDMQRAQ